MRIPELTLQEDTVLRLIGKGKRSGQIAEILDLSPSRTSQIITSLVTNGFIIRPPRTSYQPYQLTLLATEHFSFSGEGREKLNIPTYNGLHKISFRYDVKKWSPFYKPDYEIQLKNWSQGVKNLPNLEIRSSTTCLEAWWDERRVKDPIDAEEMATLRANLIKGDLERAGFVFKGEPYPNRKWKHSIDDPVIQGLDPGYLEGEGFLVDNTPKPNTLHLFKAERVKSHLDLPEKIEELQSHLDEGFARLYSLLEINIEKMNEVIQKLTPKELEEPTQMYG